MTQSKPVKKKKKTKTKKPRDEENEVNSTRPPTPMDKRKVAANNVREMIKEAHQMHKNHTRSLKGVSAPTSKDTIGKPKESEKSAAKNFNDGRYLTIEMSKRNSKTKKGEAEKKTSLIKMKIKQILSEEMVKRDGPSRKGSTESGRKKTQVITGRRASAEFQAKKKEETISRGGSAVFPARRRIDVLQRQESAEFPSAKTEGKLARGIGKKSRESSMKIKDYQVGTFVSLELLDKMKCHESDTRLRSRKGIVRQCQRDTTHNPKEASSKSSDIRSKKLRENEKKKKDDGAREKISSAHKVTGEKRRTVKKITPQKRAKIDSESASVKRETTLISQTKSVISNPKSASSNLESNISSLTGAGDLFSSNTSRSYFSSDSDISKIDKKFMQILEAVTQTKIGFEERAKQMTEEQTNDRKSPCTSKNQCEEMEKREPTELEQKLLDRISYLEQKLEKSKPSVEDSPEKKRETEDIGKGDSSTKDEIDELWLKKSENDSPQRIPDKKPKEEGTPKVKKITKSYEGLSFGDAAQLPQPSKMIKEPVTEVKLTSMSESTRSRENGKEETSSKKRRRHDSKSRGKETAAKEGGRIAPAAAGDKDGEKNAYKRVETWSIIKRLEKAFQTLGLNMDDLDNSDENENASAKKKPRVKKQVSSGQENMVLPQSETLRRCQEAAQASIDKTVKSVRATGDTSTFTVEINGSGDKNTEYKQVRNSKKTEDFVRDQKEKSRDKTQRHTYYASVRLSPPVKISQGYDLNGLPDGKHLGTIKSKSSRKRTGDGEKQSVEHEIIPQKPKTTEEVRSFKRNGKRSYKSYFDDGYMGHGKSRSVHSLSVSSSTTSVFEEDDKTRHKRKKKNHSLVREPYTRVKEVSTNTNTKPDTKSQMFMTRKARAGCEGHPQSKCSTENVETNLSGVKTSMIKTHKILKMEEESDELNLKEIRQRHRQIISEIKLSLEEIKRQHNLCTKLRRQTKQFNRDCHAKRRMLVSYLKDVETSYERRNGKQKARDVIAKQSRALSTDSYDYNLRKNYKIRGKFSDCDVHMMRPQKYGKDERKKDMGEIVLSMTETDNETSTESEVFSSIVLDNTSTELAITDTAGESYRSMTSSLHTVCRNYTPKTDTTREEGIRSMDIMCLQWKGEDKQNSSEEGVRSGPGYLVQLLQKLNRIIVTEKNQLEDLVVKASASSNRSTQSNKTKSSMSTKSSGNSSLRAHHRKSSSVTRPSKTKNEICPKNLTGNGSIRQQKSKGNNKNELDNSPEREEGIPMSTSRSFIRGDPGGCQFNTVNDQELEMVLPESYPMNRIDTMSQCGTSCVHFEKHAEEHRYRKGDPSFRSQTLLLQQLGEHSRHCMEKVNENDAERKRKIELERILRVNEKMFRRTTTFGRDTGTHALDYDPYITGKGRQVAHGRHRQQSIIIDHNDHNRGEENEESQTVLDHASRHSGVFGLRKYDRKVPHEYLKGNRKCESSHAGRYHEYWKKGKKHYADEFPNNFWDISVNTPGSSARLKDAHCQTDKIEEYDDIRDMYLLEESGSSPSLN